MTVKSAQHPTQHSTQHPTDTPRGLPDVLRGGDRLLLGLALLGSLHALAMLGVETNRFVYSRTQMAELQGDISELEGDIAYLEGVIAHRNDPRYREQLARRHGFVRPEETRVITLAPRDDAPTEPLETP